MLADAASKCHTFSGWMAIVSSHFGTEAYDDLVLALEGLRAQGHELELWCWFPWLDRLIQRDTDMVGSDDIGTIWGAMERFCEIISRLQGQWHCIVGIWFSRRFFVSLCTDQIG